MTDKLLNNWAGNEYWKPQNIVHPSTLEELSGEIVKAESANMAVKAMGSRHSFSRCASTEFVQIDMSRLNRLISVNKSSQTVTVEAGIKLKDLYAILDESNLALSTIPNTNEITLGGAISAVTHGSSLHYGTFPSLVNELTLVGGGGKVYKLSESSIDPKHRGQFETALTSFGAAGVIYSVTLQLVEPYDILLQRYLLDKNNIVGTIEAIADQFHGFQCMVFPFHDTVFVKSQTKLPFNHLKKTRKNALAGVPFEALLWAFNPIKSSPISSFSRRALSSQFVKKGLFGLYRSHSITSWCDGELARHKSKFINMEYALPISCAEDAIRIMTKISKEYKDYKGYVRELPFIIRPVGSDSLGYLSPTYQRRTCYIDILYQSLDTIEIDYFKSIEHELLKLGGRVSWSRKFFASGHAVLENYPKHREFIKIRDELDPQGIFFNEFSKDLLTKYINSS